MSRIRYSDRPDYVGWGLGALIVALLIVVVIGAVKSVEHIGEWDKWAKTHCIVNGKISGDLVIMSNGTVGSTSSKTGYLCDDGVQYWR